MWDADLSFPIRQTSRIAGLRDDGLVANNENSELSDDLKSAVNSAYAAFMQGIDPHLQKQFAEDGFPETLCHYTDFWGLKGILETGTLWATYTQTLNDDSEIEYGLEVVRDYVAKFPDKDTSFRLANAIERMDVRTFACCFCERSDLLSMWITYAKRGGGYCLEFEGNRGLLACSFPPFSVRLPFRMSYGKTLPKAVEAMLEHACQFARSGDIEAIVSASWIKKLAMRFKHPAFKHEEERRIVIPDPPVSAMRFRAGDADVKPYIELLPVTPEGSRKLPLRRITFGPTLRNDKVLIEALGLMLERYGYKGVPVESCGIPYRL
jgi:hypothetical protein